MSERFFELQGLSHLALNSADMARTVNFYEGLLGIPLVKTLDVPGSNGGQHFFFDVGCDECLAFFYFPDMPKRDVPVDKGLGGPTPPGLMNHVAFKVSQNNFDGYRRKLDELGVKYTYIRHDTDGGYSMNPADPTNDKSFALSVYFHDPDLINTILSKYSEITPTDIQRVARQYLGASQRTVVWTNPKPLGAK